MLPGKKYKPEDFLRIAWARKWFIVVPTLLIAAATLMWSFTLPNRFVSRTTILVIPQRVPESIVQSTVTTSVAERLQTISQQILSRTRLERIIEEFNLYQAERQTMIMEDIIDLMRTRDVKIDVPRPRRRNEDASQFTVGYESNQPRTSMLVAERLAAMFVQENLQDREILADSTSQFLQAQLDDARRRLTEHEAKLELFRRQNTGRLPSQSESNLHMLQMTQAQIQSNVEAANRESDRISALDLAITDGVAALEQARANGPRGKEGATAAQQLEAARESLRALEQRLKPTHPDVTRAKRLIAELEKKAADETAVGNPGPDRVVIPAGAVSASAAVTRLSTLRLEREQLRKSLDTRKAEDERLKKVLASYAARLETAPKLESELAALTRDYSTLQEQYETLLRKSEESKIAVNLERRQIGEQFKVIDGARLPERPISPNRLRLNLLGLLAGLGFGIALVALLEYRDTTLKTDNDIIVSLALPVLAVIPAMVTTMDRRRIRRRRVLVAVSASLATVVLAVAVVMWRPELLQAWVR